MPGKGAAFALRATAAEEADMSAVAHSAKAEGKRKGNCVAARRGGKEAQRESTGQYARKA